MELLEAFTSLPRAVSAAWLTLGFRGFLPLQTDSVPGEVTDMGPLSPGRTLTQRDSCPRVWVWGVECGPMCLPVLELPARSWAFGLSMWKRPMERPAYKESLSWGTSPTSNGLCDPGQTLLASGPVSPQPQVTTGTLHIPKNQCLFLLVNLKTECVRAAYRQVSAPCPPSGRYPSCTPGAPGPELSDQEAGQAGCALLG